MSGDLGLPSRIYSNIKKFMQDKILVNKKILVSVYESNILMMKPNLYVGW